MEIKDSHIMITGSNRGIGRAVAMSCAEDKAHLHLVNRTLDEELSAELTTAGAASVTNYILNLSSGSEIQKFIEANKALHLDILFNNAGQLTGGLLEEQNINDINSMLQVNVNALIHLTHGFLPGMLQRKRGKIINHSSVSAIMHFPCASTYAASKAAVYAFTQCLRAELNGTGVTTLTLITPGVETRMYADIANKYGKNMDLSFLKSMPVKQYALRIREAILEDLEQLQPSGVSGLGVKFAQFFPFAFEKLAVKSFKR